MAGSDIRPTTQGGIGATALDQREQLFYPHVAGFLDHLLSGGGEEPVDELLSIGVLRSGGDGVELDGVGVGAGANGLRGGVTPSMARSLMPAMGFMVVA